MLMSYLLGVCLFQHFPELWIYTAGVADAPLLPLENWAALQRQPDWIPCVSRFFAVTEKDPVLVSKLIWTHQLLDFDHRLRFC